MGKTHKISLLAFMFFSLIFHSDGQAYTIKEGTVSITGNSGGSLEYSNTDNSNNSYHNKNLSFSVGSGYFIKKNLELGVALYIYYYSYSGSVDQETSGAAIQPYITFHTPIADQASVFYGLGIGYGQSRTHYSSAPIPGYTAKNKEMIVSARIGWEYFFSDWSAFQIALNAMHSNNKNTTPYSDVKSKWDSINTSFGFSIYFK